MLEGFETWRSIPDHLSFEKLGPQRFSSAAPFLAEGFEKNVSVGAAPKP